MSDYFKLPRFKDTKIITQNEKKDKFNITSDATKERIIELENISQKYYPECSTETKKQKI